MDQKHDSLSLPQVGGRGQIREWKDYEDQPGHDGHRHLSEHLGLYPLNMYTPTRFPELYSAAGVSNNLAIKDSIIHLLPDLPDVWPSGRISGLYARGGFERINPCYPLSEPHFRLSCAPTSKAITDHP